MKNDKTPHIIQKLLESGLPEQPDVCDVCGGEDTIHLDENHVFYDDKHKFEIVIPTYICSQCGDECYSDESYQKILQQVEIAKGKSYVRVEVKEGGKVLRYAVH